MLASAPGGIDSTRTGVPGELKPGILKLGMLKLGTLKLGMLGIPVHIESAAPHWISTIARLCIRSPEAVFIGCARCTHNTNRGLTAQPTGSGLRSNLLIRQANARAGARCGAASVAAAARQFSDRRGQ